MEEQCLMRGPSVSELGFYAFFQRALNLIPIFACMQIFLFNRFALFLLPMSDFLRVWIISGPPVILISVSRRIWMIALSMGVTESFPSVSLHLRNGFCALVYVGRGKKHDHLTASQTGPLNLSCGADNFSKLWSACVATKFSIYNEAWMNIHINYVCNFTCVCFIYHVQ